MYVRVCEYTFQGLISLEKLMWEIFVLRYQLWTCLSLTYSEFPEVPS